MTVSLPLFSFCLFSYIQYNYADVYVYNSENKLIEDFADQPASFGPSTPSGGLKGFITETNPKNACTKVSPPPNINIPSYRWIALIPRTKAADVCDFDLKVLNAQNANFSAVIIYNYDDVLVTMGTHDRDIQIPSTLITYSDGISIISNYMYNKTVKNSTPEFYVRIDSEQIFKFSGYIIPMIATISVTFLILISIVLIKWCLQRRRARRHRLPRSALKQLKTKKFVKGDRWEVCAICLDDYEDGAKLRILPCDHAYHMKCIDPWLINNRRQCPVCKRYVFPNRDNPDEEEEHGHGATERTPLLSSVDQNSIPDPQLENQFLSTSITGLSNISLSNTETVPVDDDETRLTRTNTITTNDLIFDQPSSFSEDSRRQVSDENRRQSGSSVDDFNDSTLYESIHNSASTLLTTPRVANFFVGSLSGTTDNTNVSASSAVDSSNNCETDSEDERRYPVPTDVRIRDGDSASSVPVDVHRTNT